MLLGFALAVELERLGAHDAGFIAEHVHGYDEFMAAARAWPVETRRRRPAACAAEDIRTLAGWMAEADPLVMAPGNGLERGRNGGSGIRAAIALPALLGKLDARTTASCSAPATPSRRRRRSCTGRTSRRRARARSTSSTSAGTSSGDDIDPPLRALFIYNHNPIVVHPDQNRMKARPARGRTSSLSASRSP